MPSIADGVEFPPWSAFVAAVDSNQINGGQPEDADEFCARGTWTVGRYIRYVTQVHETVMTPAPPVGYDINHPPAG